MSKAKTAKASRTIPEHVKRAVNARDNFTCRICGVRTEFIHYDHIFPYDLGGPNTVENVQTLCPKCNTSKGNKVQCHHCQHWLSPEHTHCTQCGTRFPYSKRSQTLAGKLDDLFQRVGRVVVIGGAALFLLVLLVGGFYISRYFRNSSITGTDQASVISSIVNDSFPVAPAQPAMFKIIVPGDAKKARVVGGYKVTAGGNVNFYIVSSDNLGNVAQGGALSSPLTSKERSESARLRQPLRAGTFYLIFASPDANNRTVAAEFYLKHD